METTSAKAAAEIKDSILDAIGETPLVRLSRLGAEVRPQLVAKVEALNPGGSIKDRIALGLIEAAEREGRLKPGGTIIEPTSGNTGTGLAVAARLKGYRVIAVMPDKMSREKIDLLRAYGAEVVVAPTDVPPDSPQSYYRVADRLTEEIAGAFQPNQYRNPANPQTHYETTGPELWRQTAGLEIGEHTSELQSPCNLVCRLLLEKKTLGTSSHKHSPHQDLDEPHHASVD